MEGFAMYGLNAMYGGFLRGTWMSSVGDWCLIDSTYCIFDLLQVLLSMVWFNYFCVAIMTFFVHKMIIGVKAWTVLLQNNSHPRCYSIPVLFQSQVWCILPQLLCFKLNLRVARSLISWHQNDSSVLDLP